jgi:hypothetical protein
MARPQVVDGDSHQLRRAAANKLNKQPRTANKEQSSSLRGWRGTNNPSPQKKNKTVTNFLNEPQTWADSLGKRPKLQNMDMRFGM